MEAQHRTCSKCKNSFSKATCDALSFSLHVQGCKKRKFEEEDEPLVVALHPFSMFKGKRFELILADPPWQYKSNSGLHGCAGDSYKTMPIKDICALPVGEYLAADTCALLLWTTGPFQKDAITVMERWGFTYKTIMWVWVKRRGNGNVHCGLGRYTRSATEICLLGVRGNVSRLRQSASVGQLIQEENAETPIVDALLRQHSRKPDIVFNLITEFFPKDIARIELFAREKRTGWTRWGDEINKF